MLKLSPVFQEKVERGMRFREYFYLCILSVFSVYQLSGIGGTPSRIEIFIYFVAVFLSILIDRRILFWIRQGMGTDWFTIVSVGKDILLLTFLLHLTGGIESPFIFLYFLIAIGVAAAMGFIYGLYVLFGIFISFFILVYLEYKGFITHHPQYYFNMVQFNYKNIFLLIMVTFEIFLLGILAVFSNRYISRRLRLKERELADKIEEINKINKQLENSNAELINLTSQIEFQKEILARSNRLQKVLYDITSYFVEQHRIEVMVKKIHNQISNIMPVMVSAVIMKEKDDKEFRTISSATNFVLTTEIIHNFQKTVELNDILIDGEFLFLPVKIDSTRQIIMLFVKDPHSRQLREEEIRVLITIAKQIDIFIDRLQLYEKLQHLSNTDGLTGLYNHRFFHIRLEEEISRCVRNNKPVSLIIVDMDNFKEVNDRYGHQEGDSVLNFIAGVIKDGFRNSDVLARYGGDEFVAILPETDCNTAHQIARRIAKMIASIDIPVRKDKIRLSICVGISCMSPEDTISSRELVSRADTALYEAKKSGPGNIRIS